MKSSTWYLIEIITTLVVVGGCAHGAWKNPGVTIFAVLVCGMGMAIRETQK
jgi:hypothetical protein